MSFGQPRLLWLLLVVPALVFAYALDGQRRRRLVEGLGHRLMIQKMIASTSTGRRRWGVVLLIASISLFALSLARPQIPGRARLTESRGLDLIVALDLSKSMLARDVYPSRLDRAKAELGHFIDGLHGDRVGMVAFAGETMEYPLTLDYEAAKLFWRDLTPADMPVGGTDLGRAIRAATDLLVRVRKREGKHRPAQVILLLSDGEDTEGRGFEAAKAASKLGIRIYTLGIGSAERPFVQVTDEDGHPRGYISDEAGQPVRMGLDEADLQKIASATNGDYLRLDPQRFGADRVQGALGGLERTEEEARLEREPEDVGHWFLAPAFLLLVTSGCTRERKRLVARSSKTQRGLSPNESQTAALLLILLPYLTGFDLFMRRDPHLEEGNRLLSAGKLEQALDAYNRALAARPEEPIAHFDRGSVLFALHRFAEAQKEFQRAAETHDQWLKADAYYNMGNALYRQERWREALDAYKRTLSLRADDRRAKWNLELTARKLREQPPQHQNYQNQNEDQKLNDLQSASAEPSSTGRENNAANVPNRDEKQGGETQAKAEAKTKREEPPEFDLRDAEAVLDALERVEPTVQKDLARSRAGARRATRDW